MGYTTWLPMGVTLTATSDLYRNSLVRYGAYGPTWGTDSRVRLIFSTHYRLKVQVQYRYKSSGANASLNNLDSSLLQW